MHPIQGMAILLVLIYYTNHHKLQLDGPLGSGTDFTFIILQNSFHVQILKVTLKNE